MKRTVLVLAVLLAGCGPRKPEGERLARTYCSVCHAFPEPQLLAKNAWQTGVLPQMAPHLGVSSHSLYAESQRNPNMTVLTKAVSDAQWEKIVAYYLAQAPDSLPYQVLPAEPQVDPAFFHIDAFASHLVSSSIITLLEADSARERIFVGEAGSNRLRVFDLSRRVRAMLTLGSPPTDVIPEDTRVLVLESGILDPNDEAKGRLVQYDRAGDSLRFARVLIDSLFRPVFVAPVDFDKDGRTDYLICEYGDNRGRLALYRDNGSTYERQVLDATPGAIRFEIRDLTGDGAPDIVALFAQADERIVLFANDGAGHFTAPPRILLRFPPVYGSMYFAMDDFNGDGKLDIVYVNGDNFDYSRVLKPYHGVRIFENDGRNGFHERYFFPVYGAARAAVADFDRDGDLDIMTTSNFADAPRHAERGILYLENAGSYVFRPFAFSVAAGNQWNLMATADLNKDGRPDLIVGAMYLENIARRQRYSGRGALDLGKEPLLFFENRTGGGHQVKIDPKYWIVFLITLVLVAGEARYNILGGYDRLATTLGICMATEIVLSWWLRGRVANLASAYITGISLALLTKPQANILWPFALGAFLAIASKYVLTYRGRHLWNPSNFAIALLLLIAADSVAVLSHQWGNDLRINLVIWAFGLVVASRARVLHVTLTYVACFLVFALLRNAITGGPLLAELAPITGPMYQLFVFFMVTDPRTTVSTPRGRMVVVAIVALVETIIRLAGDYQLAWLRPFYPSPPLLALAIVGPIAMWWDLRRQPAA